jgi:hypothetical protein
MHISSKMQRNPEKEKRDDRVSAIGMIAVIVNS